MNYLRSDLESSIPAALSGLEAEPALALPALSEPGRSLLLGEAVTLEFRKARDHIGEAERRVWQRMEVMGDFPADSRFRALAAEFQAAWDRALEAAVERWFEGRLTFNDLMLQRYDVGELGITPHRDRTGYRNLVCLFVLAGRGRFFVCADRSGRCAREIAHRPGDVLLMRGPGFLGANERPFHFVREISETRYVFGLRHDRDLLAGPA